MLTTTTTNSKRRRQAGLLLGLGLAAASFSGTAVAKEIGSGGTVGGVGTAVCNPVTSLTVKSDPRVGELGFASIQTSYGVKPCTNGQAVTVEAKISEWANPSVVIYDDPNAPLNNKFVANGVRLRVTYQVTISVYDATTGALAGTLSAFTAAVPKGV